MAEAYPPLVDLEEEDDDWGPRSRARSNTWPLLPRAERVDQDEDQHGGQHLHQQQAAPVPLPPPPLQRRGMESIAEVQDECATAAPASQAAAGASRQPTKPRNAWGNSSYADLIAQAILSSPERRLTLSQIYRWMEDNVPYFRTTAPGGSSTGWKNSVRHNLSLLERFVRVQNDDKGQSSWWTVDPDAKPGRGSRTRRRAASTETSKMTEQRRSRVLKKAEALRKAKQQAEAAAQAQARDIPLTAEQLASSLGRYMALDGYLTPCSSYRSECSSLASSLSSSPQQGFSYLDVPRTSPPQLQGSHHHHHQQQLLEGLYDSPTSPPQGYQTIVSPDPGLNNPLDYEQAVIAALADSGYLSQNSSPQLQGYNQTQLSNPECSGLADLQRGYQVLPTRHSDGTALPVESAQSRQQRRPSSQAASRPPSPPKFQQLPTFLQHSTYPSSAPFELPTILPGRSDSAQIKTEYFAEPKPSPPLYQQVTADSSSASYQSDHSSPIYEAVSPYPSPPLYQSQPAGQQYPNEFHHLTLTPSPPLQPQGQSSGEDLASLPLLSVDSTLNCDVDAVLRQELILEGNLDFNFSQPHMQQSANHFSEQFLVR